MNPTDVLLLHFSFSMAYCNILQGAQLGSQGFFLDNADRRVAHRITTPQMES